MKHTTFFTIVFLIPLVSFFFTAPRALSNPAVEGFQASFLYKGNSAHNDDHHGDFDDLQGISNGNPALGHSYWYFSRSEGISPPREIFLYRVGYEYHLANDFPCNPQKVRFNSGIECHHVGDIKYFAKPNSSDAYIFAGFDSCTYDRAYIAVFRANDFNDVDNYIDVHGFIDITGPQGIDQSPWVTAYSKNDQSGNIHLYSGSGKVVNKEHEVYEYEISWADIELGGQISIANTQTYFLRHQENNDPFVASDWQGADFSADGSLFFLSVGYDTFLGCAEKYDKRIHSFKTNPDGNWHHIRSSTYEQEDLPFLFEVNCEEEPEGISWFDMHEVSGFHPSMPRGELHAILLNNDASNDQVYIKHYSSVIDILQGDSIYDAYNYRQEWGEGAWDGSVLRIQPGQYNESFTLQGKKVRITANGGSVTIGQ